LLVLLLVALLTPPGQAATGWVGDLVSGGGDDTKPQTLSERLANALLLGTGSAPGGETYEVFADLDTDEGMCVFLNWTGDTHGGFGTCQSESPLHAAVSVPFVDNAASGVVVVAGLARPGASRVELSYTREGSDQTAQAPVRMFRTDDAILRQLGATPSQALTFFVGFLPEGVGDVTGSSTARAAAYDDAGQELGATGVSWVRARLGPNHERLASCGTPGGIIEHLCNAASHEDVRVADLLHQLTGRALPESLVTRAAAAGIELRPASHQDFASISDFDSPGQPPRDPLGALIRSRGQGKTGDYAVYLARETGIEQPVYAVYLAIRGDLGSSGSAFDEHPPAATPGPGIEQELIGIFNADTGEQIAVEPIGP
jgi:hypothetical protein